MELDPDRLARRLAALEHAPLTSERKAAVAVALHDEGDGAHVLLMRRIVDPNDRWSGQISLPGGHHEEEDDDLVATAIRETVEEVGVDLAAGGQLLGPLAPIQARTREGLLPLWIAPLVFVTARRLAPTPGPEASEAFWFPLAPAARGELDSVTVLRPETGELVAELPCWRHEGRVIWGLTYRILSGLIALP